MILTRILLDTLNPHTMQALGNPNIFHGAIQKAVEGRETPLWRIDTLRGNYYLMILSQKQLDIKVLTSQFGPAAASAESADYTRLLERLKPDTLWRFKLTANPTVSIHFDKSGKTRGKVVACIHEEQQIKWLEKKSIKYGFTFQPDEVRITGRSWISFKKKKESSYKNKVRFLKVTYEGILKITDTEMFKQALERGIGKEKAYGMGLLTIMSINHE